MIRRVKSSPSEPPTGTVTFLFTDMEGSTRLAERLGRRFNDLIEDHNRLLRNAFSDGHIVRTEGDACFVAFTSAPAAVAAAIAAQRALAAHDWGEGTSVKVRMGLHTGEGVIAGGDYAGLDVHRAARIAAAAHGGQVLLSEATRALAQASCDVRDLGDHRLKDLPHPEHLFQLVLPGLPGDFPPPRSLDARPHNLAVPLTPFIGRERELEQVKDLCASSHLVTLTGPGGTGKTRLSLQVATQLLDEFHDGAYFVPLAPLVDPGLVPTTIATAVHVKEEPNRQITDTLTDHLRDKEMLLVLDNFEQIIEAAPTVSELLSKAPGLKCLVTSREVLRVTGEQEYPVPPMNLPDPRRLPDPDALAEYESVALFVQTARAVRPDFRLTEENAPAVAGICTRLDGLPLAIELAAARVRLLSPQKILERLEPALPLLTGGRRDQPARQQTLRDTIGWSYDLLDEGERGFFRRLSVFVGGFPLEGAESVCNPGSELGPETLEALESLVDKSLLRQHEMDGEPRFRMLHVIREYAHERLGEAEDADEVRARHAEFFLALAEEAQPQLMGAEQARWLDRLELEHDNLRGALAWTVETGRTETALRMAATLWRFWQMRGHLREARERLAAALALPEAAEYPEARAAALEAAGGIAYWMGDMESAAGLYEECLELRRELDDPAALAEAAYNRACIYVFATGGLRDEDAADDLLAEAEEIFRREGDSIGVAKVLWATGGNRLAAERPEAAIPPYLESLELYREAGDRFGEAWGLHMLALAEVETGALDEARDHALESLDIFVEADDRSAIPLLVTDFAILATKRGDGERALRLAGAASALERESSLGMLETSFEITRSLNEMWNLLPRKEAERYFAEGEALSAEEAIAMARKEGP